MNREEALVKVRGYLTDLLPIEDYDEVEEIMTALKQEPCEDDEELDFVQPHKKIKVNLVVNSDTISRQAVKEQMIKYGFHAPDMTVTEFVEELPPVSVVDCKTCKYYGVFSPEICARCNDDMVNYEQKSVSVSEKVGKWIEVPRYKGDSQPNSKCPFCGIEVDYFGYRNYCPN